MWTKMTSAFRRSLNPRIYPKVRTRHVRLAVTGYSRAGKTVFLTSLINHLSCHDPSVFKLAPDPIELVEVDSRQPKKTIWDSFPYASQRTAMVDSRTWPDKTKASYQYTLSFCRDDSFLTRQHLTLYDLPGERFADLAMTYMDFDEWSHNQLQFLATQQHGDSGTSQAEPGGRLAPVTAFCQLAHRGPESGVQEGDVILAYKRALAALRHQFHAQISPSTFVLDEKGATLLDAVAKIRQTENIGLDDLIEKLIRKRYAGLPEDEFAPLGEAWREDTSEMAQRFAKRYDRYRQQLVTPVFKRLITCDGLVILIDVADILATGPEHLNDSHEFMKQILAALQPGGRIMQWIAGRIGLRRRIKRIAIAASQCDRFHPDDRDRLQRLVRLLSNRLIRDIPGVTSECLAISAVESTRESPEDSDKLEGILCYDTGAESYYPSRIPEDWADRPGWPSEWDPSEFSFPRVLPKMPRVYQAVPNHVGLARIFGFVTGWFPRASD